jgi:galactose mutarotase-like enzyme
LLLPDSDPSLFAGGVLPVDHAQFERRAIVLEHGAGSKVHYGVPGKPGVEVATWGLPNLGIWSRPDAPFLCIEPWQGMPPFLGASAALEQRPGVATVPPGENHRVGMTLRFGVTL